VEIAGVTKVYVAVQRFCSIQLEDLHGRVRTTGGESESGAVVQPLSLKLLKFLEPHPRFGAHKCATP
jgi:hypothetical protein